MLQISDLKEFYWQVYELWPVLIFLITAVAASLLFPSWADMISRPVLSGWRAVGRRPVASILIVSALPVLVRLSLLPWIPVPDPLVHDEFSYLLAADTFASGRITNPAHPLWHSFESFHILNQPSYMSMYFPGQGAVLAIGKVLFGHPWGGVVLSMAIFLGLLCWALQAIVPSRWALFGGLAFGMSTGVFHYWMNSYWGGAVPGIGGCLVAGAALRLNNDPWQSARRWRGYLLVASAGVVVLVNSRPWEGLFVVLPCSILIAYTILRRTHRPALEWARIMAPSMLLLTCFGALQLYYNYRVAGSPFELPYTHQRKMYEVVLNLPWHPRPPVLSYRHPEMRKLYVEWETTFQDADLPSTPRRWFRQIVFRTLTALKLFPIHFLLALPALMLAWRARGVRPLFGILSATVIGISIQAYLLPHYLAPIAVVLVGLTVVALRYACAVIICGRRFGLPLILVGLFSIGYGAKTSISNYLVDQRQGFVPARQAVIRRLQAQSGSHLVFVRYTPQYDIQREWVYNNADIDKSQIVWARFYTEESRLALMRYYRNRAAWVLNADTLELSRIPQAAPAPGAYSRLPADHAAE